MSDVEVNICYCSGTYGERIPQTVKCVERIGKYVDRRIIIVDESVTEEQIKKLKDLGCEVYVHPWEDSMVKMRSQYLAKLQTGDWAIVSDPDELFGEEFCKDIRKIIAKAEKDGFGLLLIASHDITKRVNGAVEENVSGYMKNLIFKKNEGVKYVGVGVVKEVHENLQLAPNTKILRLDPKYYYDHLKEEHQIWERAARNVFIAGGGNNVGELNPAWKPLRQICAGLGLENWPQARAYLRKGGIDEMLKQWIINHRFEGTDFEHEMMEFFIWYKWMHPEELGGTEPIKNFKGASWEEVTEYVGTLYRETTGERISGQDKESLAKAVISGQIEQKNLIDLFRSYKREVKGVPAKKGERVRLPVPVDVDVHVTEELFEKALVRSKTFWGKIKPRMDLGKFVENQVWDKLAFHGWFYQNRNEITFEDLQQYVQDHGMNTLALCIMGYHDVMPMILENIRMFVKPAGIIYGEEQIDEIHVQGDDFTEEDIKTLEGLGCEVHIEPWNENTSDYKNKILAHANTQWVLELDHDEIPTPEMAGQLREIIKNSEGGEKYNMVRFGRIDVTTDKKGKVISEVFAGPGKPILHVNVKDAYYEHPHPWLKPDYYSWKSITVDYAYNHVRFQDTILRNAVRNVFWGGGGDNWREKNELWVELRGITDELKIFTWKGFNVYLEKGNIDPRLKNLFERLYKKPWHDEELRAFKTYYYKLHPKEAEE